MATGLPISRDTCGEGSCGKGVGGLQRGWLAAAASRARPLKGDEKVGSRGRVFGSGLRPSPTEKAPLEVPDVTVKV